MGENSPMRAGGESFWQYSIIKDVETKTDFLQAKSQCVDTAAGGRVGSGQQLHYTLARVP